MPSKRWLENQCNRIHSGLAKLPRQREDNLMTTPNCGLTLQQDGLPSENIYGTRGQQCNSSERDGCLNHHQNLGPARKHRYIRRRKCGAGVVCEKKIINETRAPPLLAHLTAQLRIQRHLREEKHSIRMGVLEISLVVATSIQPPVPAGKD